MSQAGIIDFQSSNPQIPTNFVADVGTAIPIANTIEFLGEIISASSTPFQSVASGNTVTYQLQTSNASASSSSNNAGVSSFNSNHFTVDSNGFVSVNGAGVAQTITGQTGGALSPTLGNWNIFGGTVLAGTSPLSSSGSGSTLTINAQRSQAIASADSTKIGLSNFNSSHFSVDSDGFVSLAGGGISIDSIIPNSGTSPVVANASGEVSIVGSGSITTVGSLNTETIQLTGLTNHSVQVGAGTDTLTQVSPSATVGYPLLSNGSSADPSFNGAIVGDSLTLPNTTSSSLGVINLNSNRFMHSYGNIRSTFLGQLAGNFSATTNNLTGIGYSALTANSTGSDNTGCGSFALTTVSTGSRNVGVGTSAIRYHNSDQNTGVGANALLGAPGNTAANNSCIGYRTLYQLASGIYNIVIGSESGTSYTTSESHNILLNNAGTIGESNVLRIGSGTGTGTQQLNSAIIHGITGVTQDPSATVKAVTINTSTSQLGVSTLNGVFDWTDENASFNAEAQEGYFVTATATASLPASPSQGDTISFALDTANVLTIQASGTQVIRVGSSVSSAAGTAVSTAIGDSITLVYRASSTSWIATSVIGTFTLA